MFEFPVADPVIGAQFTWIYKSVVYDPLIGVFIDKGTVLSIAPDDKRGEGVP